MWALQPGGMPQKHHLAVWRLAVERGVPWRPPGAEGLRLMAEPARAQPDAVVISPQHENASEAAPAEVVG